MCLILTLKLDAIVEVMSISICEMTTTLIILELQLVHHFIEGTDIDTTDINTRIILVLLVLALSNSPVLLLFV
jgi:hypothetical protein